MISPNSSYCESLDHISIEDLVSLVGKIQSNRVKPIALTIVFHFLFQLPINVPRCGRIGRLILLPTSVVVPSVSMVRTQNRYSTLWNKA